MINKEDLILYLSWQQFYRELIVKAWLADGQLRHDPRYVELIRQAVKGDEGAVASIMGWLGEGNVPEVDPDDYVDFRQYVLNLVDR